MEDSGICRSSFAYKDFLADMIYNLLGYPNYENKRTGKKNTIRKNAGNNGTVSVMHCNDRSCGVTFVLLKCEGSVHDG
jgi:hypothetical protein